MHRRLRLERLLESLCRSVSLMGPRLLEETSQEAGLRITGGMYGFSNGNLVYPELGLLEFSGVDRARSHSTPRTLPSLGPCPCLVSRLETSLVDFLP